MPNLKVEDLMEKGAQIREPCTLEKEVAEIVAGLGKFKEVRQRGD